MKERLIIENFAGITFVDLEFSEINILIGPQATGKSISAKSFFYFKSFMSEILVTSRGREILSGI